MPPQPQSPNPSYDFILKSGQTKSRSFNPLNLSGPVKIIGAVLIVIILIIVLGTALGGKNSGKAGGLTGVLGRAQEINRINTLEQPVITDPTTLDLLVTVQSALSSEQTQLTNILNQQKIKLDSKQLAAYQNNGTDQLLQSAAQNNNLPAAYDTYLRGALADYANSLVQAYQTNNSSSVKSILQSAYSSTKTLLASPPLKQ
ncbi:MAG TPA: hypothetical protein VFP35_01950 [Candidatus Saccharimonadales bacterium]|nr:hypothetical protein [Candidatus Saccharimonadales bacterium]